MTEVHSFYFGDLSPSAPNGFEFMYETGSEHMAQVMEYHQEKAPYFKTIAHWMYFVKYTYSTRDTYWGPVMESRDPGHALAMMKQLVIRDEEILRWSVYESAYLQEGYAFVCNQHEKVKRALMDTQGMVIAYADPYERRWGISNWSRLPENQDMTTWKGENVLGFALMYLRARFYYEDLLFHACSAVDSLSKSVII
jgi:predicted NAD-dependent protein-ADP-ribosyltransferase YbiA (DUF1768 family)